MCWCLDPASFLASVFAYMPDKKAFDVRQLRIVRDHVVDSLAEENLVIEWTRDAVLSTMESYTSYFEYSDGKIGWRGKDDRNELNSILNDGLSSKRAGALKTAIEESAENGKSKSGKETVVR